MKLGFIGAGEMGGQEEGEATGDAVHHDGPQADGKRKTGITHSRC